MQFSYDVFDVTDELVLVRFNTWEVVHRYYGKETPSYGACTTPVQALVRYYGVNCEKVL